MANRVDDSSAMSGRVQDMHTIFNEADNIERYLQTDGHRTWGWVIYRTTYDNDADWEEFFARLRTTTQRSLMFYGGLDMLNSMSLKIFDDRNLFEGASTSTIREHFRNWTMTAPQEEQSAGPAASQRYDFCIQVDAEALRSVVHDAPDPSQPNDSDAGWVKLIWKYWEPRTPNPMNTTTYEPIEGVTAKDVGWLRAAYQYVMVDIYCLFRDANVWHREYRRPPKVIEP